MLENVNYRKVQRFKPTGKGGGSRKGKPQGIWPWLVKVVADAVVIRSKGGTFMVIIDRRLGITPEKFAEQMDIVLPGWREVILGERKTPLEVLLMNRVYKMYYSGTSDRGRGHDPRTRAVMSGEHWMNQVPAGHPYYQIHDDIVCNRITTVENWRKYL
jgi:hypothetical protein